MSNISTPSQIKVTLPSPLYACLKSKADRLGLTMSAYVKNLIIDDVKNVDMPTFKMSAKNEKIALQALKDHRDGKTRKINKIDDYLNSL